MYEIIGIVYEHVRHTVQYEHGSIIWNHHNQNMPYTRLAATLQCVNVSIPSTLYTEHGMCVHGLTRFSSLLFSSLFFSPPVVPSHLCIAPRASHQTPTHHSRASPCTVPGPPPRSSQGPRRPWCLQGGRRSWYTVAYWCH